MFKFGLNYYHSILEIRDFAKNNNIFKAKSDKRSAITIAIIDDEPFKPAVNLSSYGYKVTEIADIKRIDEILEYDVVLCDLMGVGQHFDKSIGGASLIREIKQSYPMKFVIAYSGAPQNTTEAQTAKEFCDHFLKKDSDLTEWQETLDSCVDYITDPYLMWLATRQYLIDYEIDLRKILQMDSAYVKSVLQKDSNYTDLKKLLAKIEIEARIKGIVQSLIASAVYSLLLG